jgi:hypothetical protein
MIPATFADGIELIKNIRTEDREEVEAIGSSLLHVPFGVLMSEEAYVFHDKYGNLAGIVGIVRQSPDIGAIWLLATPAVDDINLSVIRTFKRWLDTKGEDYKMLWNLADARNTKHHKLLRFCKFKAIRSISAGPNHQPFYEIVKLCAIQ